ncbi:2-oxoglutarate-dependent dioxygenase [Cladobotryum mycophilum]|uniref:2-oxoglutarate-dependent dioxygenase n=1 Tax=Cladobotryum mycophilum TaxID=491253 RepID=A0ABR0SI42_9HYPO
MASTLKTHYFSVAPLETVNFRLLEQNDTGEVNKLVANCRAPGFFYLDLKDNQEYLKLLDVLYELSDKYFDQSEEVKMEDFRPTQDRGFKPGSDAETLEFARDELVAGQSAVPVSMGSEAPKTVQRLVLSSHYITKTMLSRLAVALKMPHLEDHHREGETSDCGLKVESVPTEERLEDVPPSEHTDMGTLTLLFCPQYTTELRVAEDKWGFIVPKPGHAIVNVADSLQRLTGKELVSSLHRVGQPTPGAGKRICALYYLRPEHAYVSTAA